MYIDIFRKYSEEETIKIERHRRISGEISDMGREVDALRYEYTHLKENKRGDLLPLFIWVACIIPVTALIVLDYLAADWDRGDGLAIAIASGLPLLFVICFIGIVVCSYRLLLRYSKHPKFQQKAAEKCIVNVNKRSKQIENQLEMYRIKTAALEDEKREIEAFLEEKDSEYKKKGEV